MPAEPLHLVLDLDGTLFNKHLTSTSAQLDSRAVALVAKFMDLDFEQAQHLMRGYLRDYGSTLQGLIRSGRQFCIESFLLDLHDVDLTDIVENERLRVVLESVPQKIYIYTNGCCHYASRVLERLGIGETVDDIFDIRMAGYISKPNAASFAAFLRHFRLNPAHCLFVDDLKQNLAVGKTLGMTTVYVDNSHDYAQEQYIDYATQDLPALLGTLYARATDSHR